MSTLSEDVIDVALRVAEALEAVGATYFVGGSFASSIDGEPRATNDIDIVVDMDAARIPELVQRLGPDFQVDEEMLRDAIENARTANAFYLPLVLKIDFFGKGRGEFDDAELSRRRAVEVRGEAALFVKSAEDTILRKLLWYRAGGGVSERQWRDVIGVIRGQHETLDDRYLDGWAPPLGLIDLLGRARREASTTEDVD